MPMKEWRQASFELLWLHDPKDTLHASRDVRLRCFSQPCDRHLRMVASSGSLNEDARIAPLVWSLYATDYAMPEWA